eukprot:8735452-Pyramimonas_sp.AAC.1
MAKRVEVGRPDALEPQGGRRLLELPRHVGGRDAEERAGQASGPFLASHRGGPPALAPAARQHPVETCCQRPMTWENEPRVVAEL